MDLSYKFLETYFEWKEKAENDEETLKKREQKEIDKEHNDEEFLRKPLPISLKKKTFHLDNERDYNRRNLGMLNQFSTQKEIESPHKEKRIHILKKQYSKKINHEDYKQIKKQKTIEKQKKEEEQKAKIKKIREKAFENQKRVKQMMKNNGLKAIPMMMPTSGKGFY